MYVSGIMIAISSRVTIRENITLSDNRRLLKQDWNEGAPFISEAVE
jgi:hypothetical protein